MSKAGPAQGQNGPENDLQGAFLALLRRHNHPDGK